MRLNAKTVEFATQETFLNQAFEAAIEHIYFDALPTDVMLAIEGAHKTSEVRDFVHNALESAGGYSLLISAYESERSPAKKRMLEGLNNACLDIAEEAAKRYSLEAMEMVHPVQATIAGLGEVYNVLKDIDRTIANFGISAATIAALFVLSVFDAVTFNGRVKSLKKKLAKAKDSKQKAKLEDKITRAEYVAEKFSGFRHRIPLDEKLNNPNILDKANRWFDDVNNGIDKLFDNALDTYEKSEKRKGNKVAVERIERARKQRDADALESFINENFSSAMEAEMDGVDMGEDDIATEEDDFGDDEFTGDNIEGDEDIEAPKEKVLAGKTLQELVLDAKMTTAELDKFFGNLERLDTAKISEIINDKIIGVIEEEKKAYKTISEANAKLKAAIAEKEEEKNPEVTEEAVQESVMSFTQKVTGSDRLIHNTLFSRMQINTSMAMLGRVATESVNVPLDAVATKVLCRTLPKKFEEKISLESVIEEAACSKVCSNDDPRFTEDREKFLKLSNLITTLIMTLIETLNTLNLQKYTRDELAYVCNKKDFELRNSEQVINNLNATVSQAFENIKASCRGVKDPVALEAAALQVKRIENTLDKLEKRGIDKTADTRKALESVIEVINERYKIIKDATAVESVNEYEEFKATRQLNNDIRSFERIAELIERKRPSEVTFTADESGALECVMTSATRPRFATSVALESDFSDSGVEKYMRYLAKKGGCLDVVYPNDTVPSFEYRVSR